jgi:hypothetical protein
VQAQCRELTKMRTIREERARVHERLEATDSPIDSGVLYARRESRLSKALGRQEHARLSAGSSRDRTPGNLLVNALEARCSSKNPMVEVAGIEPASFSTSPGLLRAQPALLFSAPAVLQASRRRAQSLLGVPLSPATGLSGGSSSLMPDTGPEELPG